jgi:hypothetical protein
VLVVGALAVVDVDAVAGVGAAGAGARDERAGTDPVTGCAARATNSKMMLATSTGTIRFTVAAG